MSGDEHVAARVDGDRAIPDFRVDVDDVGVLRHRAHAGRVDVDCVELSVGADRGVDERPDRVVVGDVDLHGERVAVQPVVCESPSEIVFLHRRM